MSAARDLYAALGVELPPSTAENVLVSCFANAEHEDRHASCSVNVTSGAFCCHGCDARGGAYDAALAHGLAPADAMAALERHGLIEDRGEPRTSTRRAQAPPAATSPASTRAAQLPSEETLTRAADALHEDERARGLAAARGWDVAVLWSLGVGWADLDGWAGHGWRRGLGGRFLLPVRDHAGRLVNVVAYRPDASPKSYAAPGRPRDLFPAPEPLREQFVTLADGRRVPLLDRLPVYLVEGEPDVLAAASAGVWPAVAVPGSTGWKSEWSGRFADMDLRVLADHDDAGRRLAQRLAGDLAHEARSVAVLDWPTVTGRGDVPAGFDLTDFARELRA